jgi:hypothetical protein
MAFIDTSETLFGVEIDPDAVEPPAIYVERQ